MRTTWRGLAVLVPIAMMAGCAGSAGRTAAGVTVVTFLRLHVVRRAERVTDDDGLRRRGRGRPVTDRRVQAGRPRRQGHHQQGRLRRPAVPHRGRQRQPAGPGLHGPQADRHLRRQGRHPAAGPSASRSSRSTPRSTGRPRCSRSPSATRSTASPSSTSSRPTSSTSTALDQAGVTPEQIQTKDWGALPAPSDKLFEQDGSKIRRIGYDPKLPDSFPLWAMANGATIVGDDGAPQPGRPQGGRGADSSPPTWSSGRAAGAKFKAFRDSYDIFGEKNPLTVHQHRRLPDGELVRQRAARLHPGGPEAAVDPVHRPPGQADQPARRVSAWAIPKGAKNPVAACAWAKTMTSTDTWMKAAEAREATVAKDKSFFTGLFTANKAADDQIREKYLKDAPDPGFEAASTTSTRRSTPRRRCPPRRPAPRSMRRGRARCPGRSRAGPGHGPGAGPEGGTGRLRQGVDRWLAGLQRRETRAALGLHLAVDHRLPRLHRRPDDRQPRAVLHRLLPGRGTAHGVGTANYQELVVGPAGAHLAAQHVRLRRALRAARHGRRARPGPAAAAGRPRRRLLPHGLLPAGDDAGRRGRRDVPAAAQRPARPGQPGARLGRHRGTELDHRPQLAQALAGCRQPVGGRRQRGHLPCRAAERAAAAVRGGACSTAPAGAPVPQRHPADDLRARSSSASSRTPSPHCRCSTRRTRCSTARSRRRPPPTPRWSTWSTCSRTPSSSSRWASPRRWPGCCSSSSWSITVVQVQRRQPVRLLRGGQPMSTPVVQGFPPVGAGEQGPASARGPAAAAPLASDPRRRR